MKSTHRWLAVDGSHISDDDAAVIGERIEALSADGAVVDRQLLVDDARPANSPTHGYFEWHDSTAAERYRLQQAHHYLRSIMVQIVPASGGEPVPVRAFHCVTLAPAAATPGPHGYVPVARALADDELWAQVLQRAKAELVSWQRRYKMYKGLQAIAEGPVQAAIDGL